MHPGQRLLEIVYIVQKWVWRCLNGGSKGPAPMLRSLFVESGDVDLCGGGGGPPGWRHRLWSVLVDEPIENTLPDVIQHSVLPGLVAVNEIKTVAETRKISSQSKQRLGGEVRGLHRPSPSNITRKPEIGSNLREEQLPHSRSRAVSGDNEVEVVFIDTGR